MKTTNKTMKKNIRNNKNREKHGDWSELNEKYDAKMMFRHACAFSDIADLCVKEPSPFMYRTLSHSVSGIANSAFACEIFLKALLINGDISEESVRLLGHDLYDLWNKYRDVDTDFVNNTENDFKIIYKTSDDNMFSNKLNIAANAFDHWRYLYETKSSKLDKNFLIMFRNTLRNECSKKLYGKNWEEYEIELCSACKNVSKKNSI